MRSGDSEDLDEAAPDPPFVVAPADKQRWDLCEAIAWQMFEPDAAGAWMAARVLFQSDIPVG